MRDSHKLLKLQKYSNSSRALQMRCILNSLKSISC